MKRPTVAQMTAQCDRWNAANPVGTPVNVTMDNGNILQTVTESKAQMLSGHTPVIWVRDVSGCYLLSRVTRRLA